MKERIFDIIKWIIILIIAAAIYHALYKMQNRYVIINTPGKAIYRLNERTGEVVYIRYNLVQNKQTVRSINFK